MCQLLAAARALGLRHEDIHYRPPDDIGGAISERALRRGVELDNASVLINRDDAVEGGVEHAGLARLALLNLVLHSLAREKLPDLCPNRGEHPQQVVVGPADAARE